MCDWDHRTEQLPTLRGSKRTKVTFKLFTNWELGQTKTNTMSKGQLLEDLAVPGEQ